MIDIKPGMTFRVSGQTQYESIQHLQETLENSIWAYMRVEKLEPTNYENAEWICKNEACLVQEVIITSEISRGDTIFCCPECAQPMQFLGYLRFYRLELVEQKTSTNLKDNTQKS